VYFEGDGSKVMEGAIFQFHTLFKSLFEKLASLLDTSVSC